MGRKLTTAEFIERARKIHGDRYDYSQVGYVNNRTKVAIICPQHGVFFQAPDKHLSKRGCPACGVIKRANRKRKTTETFIRQAREVHADKYDYSAAEYAGAFDLVIIRCPIHGEFKQKADVHLRGYGCPQCGLTKQVDARRDDTDSFINKARVVHGDVYDYSRVDYIDSHTKVKIICPIHGQFQQAPNSHLMRSGCTKCGITSRTRKQSHDVYRFIADAKAVHGERYDYSQVEYVNALTKVKIICPKHGVFQQIPAQHKQGSGCRKCAYESLAELNRKDAKAFISKAHKIHGDKYDYSDVNYLTANTKVIICCKVHGEFLQTPAGHLNGRGCKQCGMDKGTALRTSNRKEFIRKARDIHGDSYEYSEVNYITASKKVCIICKRHGVFYQTPNSHLNGRGCPVCKIELIKKSETKTTSQFIDLAREVHGEKYDYSQTEYVGSHSKVKILCKKHGAFEQTATNHLMGRGCHKCAEQGFNPGKPGTLYYLRVGNRTHTFWKIGITNRSVMARFLSDMRQVTVIKTWHYGNGAEAYNREQGILETYEKDRYTGIEKPLRSGGNTELFTRDVLGLDAEYK